MLVPGKDVGGSPIGCRGSAMAPLWDWNCLAKFAWSLLNASSAWSLRRDSLSLQALMWSPLWSWPLWDDWCPCSPLWREWWVWWPRLVWGEWLVWSLWPGTVPTILISGSAEADALGLEPDLGKKYWYIILEIINFNYLSSLKADDLEPLLSSPEERAPSERNVLTPLSDLLSSSILHLK